MHEWRLADQGRNPDIPRAARLVAEGIDEFKERYEANREEHGGNGDLAATAGQRRCRKLKGDVIGVSPAGIRNGCGTEQLALRLK